MNVDVTWSIVAIAFVSLVGGIALFLWAVRRPRARYVNSVNVIAWLLIGLFPTLIIFSFFPGSTAEGKVVGISLSGAIAAFVAIFVLGTRAGRTAIARDQRLEELTAEIERLRAELAQRPGAGTDKRPIGEQRELRYRVQGKKGRELVIITGDLDDITIADVWVNSENTNMQMARFYDRSISSVIRYLGASKSDSGHPTVDHIGDELARRMEDMNERTVQPAKVIATGSGELLGTNRVQRVYHVASVQGEVGAGYKRISNIGQCVTNSLREADSEATPYTSILFPLLGTGTAGDERDGEIIRELIKAATEYMSANPTSRVQTVYFLARYLEHLHLCVDAANSRPVLTRAGGSAEALLESRPGSPVATG